MVVVPPSGTKGTAFNPPSLRFFVRRGVVCWVVCGLNRHDTNMD